MTFVISRLCRDCVDQACVRVCPVDCILEHVPEGRVSELPNQLFVNPDACIDCGVCEPECPWEAIGEEEEVPELFLADIALNALTAERTSEFRVPEAVERPAPTAEQVEINKKRWGLETDHPA